MILDRKYFCHRQHIFFFHGTFFFFLIAEILTSPVMFQYSTVQNITETHRLDSNAALNSENNKGELANEVATV